MSAFYPRRPAPRLVTVARSATQCKARGFSATRRVLQEGEKQRSPHAQFYSQLVPGMIPIFLLGSAVYMGLQLAHSRLSHEKYLDEAKARVQELEAEVEALRAKQGADGAASQPNSGTSAVASPKSWLGWSK